MAQLLQPVEPFGEVNVHPQPDGSLRIVATVLMEPDIEGACCGLALDGSSSMKKMYGIANTSPLFGAPENVVQPVARMMAGYLAKFSTKGTAHLVYWACGPDGGGIEAIGEVNEIQAAALEVKGPSRQSWGRNTKLLPPVKLFIDGVFRDAPWAICVFITDGIIDDLADVKRFCMEYARQIAAGRRRFCKLVLIGVGEQVDEKQMAELDDMFEGTGLKDPAGDDIDLWDHKLASEMRHLKEVFAEVVSEKIIVASSGVVRDDAGRVAASYSDGVPALLRFTLPRGSRSFTLDLPNGRVTQPLEIVPAGRAGHA